jgi:hypothetical protein
MSACRVACRVALVAGAKKWRFRAVAGPTLATKVFDVSSESFPVAGGGAARRRWRGSGWGFLTGVAWWRGRGGERRIGLRGALRATPVIPSPFVTNDWCDEVAR